MTQLRKTETALQYPYATSYKLGEKPLSPIIGRVYNRLNSLPGKSIVLDVGCGAGRLPRNAPYPRTYSFLGIDINPDAIDTFNFAIKNEALPDLAIKGDITSMNFNDYMQYGEIRAAISWRVLHSLPRETQIQVSKAIFNSLPEGGEFIISALSDTDSKRKALESLGKYTPGIMNDCKEILGTDTPWPLYFFSEADISQLAQKAGGFEVIEQHLFKEESGFEGKPPVEYRYAVLKKPHKTELNGRYLRR